LAKVYSRKKFKPAARSAAASPLSESAITGRPSEVLARCFEALPAEAGKFRDAVLEKKPRWSSA